MSSASTFTPGGARVAVNDPAPRRRGARLRTALLCALGLGLVLSPAAHAFTLPVTGPANAPRMVFDNKMKVASVCLPVTWPQGPSRAGRSALQWAAMAARSLSELVAPDWADALAPVEATITELGAFLREEIAAGRSYLPAGENILRAFRQPLADVRVLIVGQDPYPTPGNPVGLSFSVAPEVRRLPGSLINIFKEYTADLGYPRPSTGDLSPWSERGVMLLNRVLTVEPGKPGSHRGKGWEQVTEQAIRSLAARGGPLVAILWGNDARNLAPLLGGAPSIQSAHPSPMSADRGFFGSRPFTRADAQLARQGGQPIDWKLP